MISFFLLLVFIALCVDIYLSDPKSRCRVEQNLRCYRHLHNITEFCWIG